MSPLELSTLYLQVFYAGQNPEALRPLLAEDLHFSGPFLECRSAGEYLQALKSDPPAGMEYEILRAFEAAHSACIIYRFSKGGMQTPMCQLFEVRAEQISRILLIFDSGAFD